MSALDPIGAQHSDVPNAIVGGEPTATIVIPCREVDEYVTQCVKHCGQLEYGRYETILLPDHSAVGSCDARVIAAG